MKQGVDKPAHPAKTDGGDVAPKVKKARVSSFRKKKLLTAARAHLWNELPAITAALVEGTKAGSIVHLKLLMELGVLEKGMLDGKVTEAREKSVEQVLMERWRMDREEKTEAERGDGLNRV